MYTIHNKITNNIMFLFCTKVVLLTVAIQMVPTRSFSQNGLLRSMFKRMTPGCNWPDHVDKSAFKKMEDCTHFDPDIKFPDYYLKDFHAYTGGNLNPMAAKEARSATAAVMNHHFEHLTGDESSHYVRSVFSIITRSKNVESLSTEEPQNVVDFGCGIGVSTKYMRGMFQDDKVEGIDLSPFFLEESTGVDAGFVHGNIEDTSIESNSVDVVTISYVLHELPYDVSQRVLREASRILKPGTGVLSVLDMHNPKSSNPLMKYIFNRTEPYLKEYSMLVANIDKDLESAGFDKCEVSKGFPKTIMWFANKKEL